MTVTEMIAKLMAERVVYGDNIEVVVRTTEGMDDEHQYEPKGVRFDSNTNQAVIWV